MKPVKNWLPNLFLLIGTLAFIGLVYIFLNISASLPAWADAGSDASMFDKVINSHNVDEAKQFELENNGQLVLPATDKSGNTLLMEPTATPAGKKPTESALDGSTPDNKK